MPSWDDWFASLPDETVVVEETDEERAALAWMERADKEHARGIRCGVVTICPRHIRPMGFKAWNGIEACGCTDDPADLHELHGLASIQSAFGASANTRRAD